MSSYNNISDFLRPTKFCDSDNVNIINFANGLTKNSSHSREKASILFNYVRDKVLYKFDYWNLKASVTLKKQTGMCTNKNNLLIACLRSIGIPAGYGILKVKAREYFGPLILPTFKKLISPYSVHIYSAVYLNNKWIKIDPSVDKDLSEKTHCICSTTKLVEWDGMNDATENLDATHILDDNYPLPNIDDKLEKRPVVLTRIKLKLANFYLSFLRNNMNFESIEDVEKKFSFWLRKKAKLLYFYYFLKKIN